MERREWVEWYEFLATVRGLTAAVLMGNKPILELFIRWSERIFFEHLGETFGICPPRIVVITKTKNETQLESSPFLCVFTHINAYYNYQSVSPSTCENNTTKSRAAPSRNILQDVDAVVFTTINKGSGQLFTQTGLQVISHLRMLSILDSSSFTGVIVCVSCQLNNRGGWVRTT